MKALHMVTAALIALPVVAQAEDGRVPWINSESDISFDFTGKKSESYELRLKMDAAFRFEVIMREGVKSVVRMRVEQVLYESGDWAILKDLDWEKMFTDAYIQVETDKVTNLPRAIVTFGKHTMAFGQAVAQTPMYRDSLLHRHATERELIGLTVDLPVNFFGVIDSVAMSVYENGSGDFQIADEGAFSIKVSRKIAKVLEAQASALVKENAGDPDHQYRASYGFVFNEIDGKYSIWAQGLWFENNPNLPNTTWGAQIGGSMKAGVGTIVIDWHYLNQHANELTFAYNIPVGAHLILSPELRQVWDLGGITADDTRIGVRTRLLYKKTKYRKLNTRPMD